MLDCVWHAITAMYQMMSSKCKCARSQKRFCIMLQQNGCICDDCSLVWHPGHGHAGICAMDPASLCTILCVIVNVFDITAMCQMMY